MTAKPEPSSLDPDRLPREKQSGEQARYKIDLPTLLDRHDMIWGDPHGPPADWRAGAPIGNGDFGAMIYGYPDAMSFVLGKSDVWNRRNDDRSEFIGETFSEYSQTFFDNDEAGFEKLRNDAKPSYRKDSPHLTTCGRFVLHLEEAAIIASCTLRAHLREGSATLRWREPNTKTEARVLVSRRFEVLSVDIQRQGEAPAAQAIEWVVEVYAPRTDTWELRRPLPMPLNHLAAVAAGGRIYILGGYVNFGRGLIISDQTLEYDPAADSWSRQADMPFGRGAHGAALLDGRIYVVGGIGSPAGEQTRVMIYDPTADSWDVGAHMPLPAEHLAVAAAAGGIYAISGRFGTGLFEVQVYDPESDSWELRAPIPTARSGITSQAWMGRIFVFGGELPCFLTVRAAGRFNPHRPRLVRMRGVPIATLSQLPPSGRRRRCNKAAPPIA